jgi:hypothetical protein
LNVHTTLGVADLTIFVCEDTSSRVRRSRVVVARFVVLTSDDFVTITNAVAISVLNVHTTLGIADFAVSVREDTSSCIRCSRVIVASVGVLASDNFITVTNTVAICV